VIAACVVPGITQALAGTRALKVYVANLHPETPETEGFTLQDHIDALERHGVNVDLVLVGERSSYASDASSVPTHVVDLSGANGLVHDVQKLAMAVLESAKIEDRRNEGDGSGNTGRD
jgi:2-phospho-L-lactate transferase/gluconeogenesis factor (CofD/UPF0052 family)